MWRAFIRCAYASICHANAVGAEGHAIVRNVLRNASRRHRAMVSNLSFSESHASASISGVRAMGVAYHSNGPRRQARLFPRVRGVRHNQGSNHRPTRPLRDCHSSHKPAH